MSVSNRLISRRMRFVDSTRVQTRGRFQYPVTVARESLGDKFAQRGFVFGDEDGFRSANRRGGDRGSGGGNGAEHLRQKNAEESAATGIALGGHPAAMLMHDAENRGQAQARALGRILWW